MSSSSSSFFLFRLGIFTIISLYIYHHHHHLYGIYILSESSATSIPQAFWCPCISATADLWHRHLGHPTPRILNLLVSSNKIVCTS